MILVSGSIESLTKPFKKPLSLFTTPVKVGAGAQVVTRCASAEFSLNYLDSVATLSTNLKMNPKDASVVEVKNDLLLPYSLLHSDYLWSLLIALYHNRIPHSSA